LVFGFLTGIAPEGVAVMPDITYYLDFAIKMFFAFGLAFEVPIATILVVWSGISTAEKLAAKRPYVIVGAFVFGMLLTPPDVISQTLLAIPMWILFELGLIFSRFYTKPKEEENSIGGDVDASANAAATAAGSTGASSRVEPTFDDVAPAPEVVAGDDAVADDYGDNVDDEDANDSGHGEFEPLTEAEMDAELDQLEAEETAEAADETDLAEGQDVIDDGQGDGKIKPKDDE
jgi:sec-independent protein translocase protein TatC